MIEKNEEHGPKVGKAWAEISKKNHTIIQKIESLLINDDISFEHEVFRSVHVRRYKTYFEFTIIHPRTEKYRGSISASMMWLEKIEMNIAYIAHPISGDVRGNGNKVIEIVRKINLEEPGVVPFAPYMVDLAALNDTVQKERDRGIRNDRALFKKGFIDEVRLYGNRISKGMRDEVLLAYSLGIDVIPMTPETELALKKIKFKKR